MVEKRNKRKRRTKEPRRAHKTDEHAKIHEERTEARRYAIFMVGKGRYALDLNLVLEVLNASTIVSQPRLDDIYAGVIKLRDRSVPVYNVQVMLAEEKIITHDRACILTSIGSSTIALLVDSEVKIVTPKRNSFFPLPHCYTEDEAGFLAGILWIDNDLFGILKPKEMIGLLAGQGKDNET